MTKQHPLVLKSTISGPQQWLAILAMAATVSMGPSLKAQSLGQGASTFHIVGLQANGLVYAWGHGNNGQLGNDDDSNSSTPVKVVKGVMIRTIKSPKLRWHIIIQLPLLLME